MASKNRIEQATCLISDLQAIHKLKENSNVPLEREGLLQYIAEIEILQYIAAHPDSTAYGFSRKNVIKMGKRKDKDGKYRDRDERWIRKQISNFVEIGLIERSQKAASQYNAKPCRLTIAGLVYLILKREIMPNDVIKGILKYYSNNALFQLFVYPYIKQDTLQRLSSFRSLSLLSSFLYDCCRELEDAIRAFNTTKNQYTTEGYLDWQSISDDNHNTKRLYDFLKRELNLEWIDQAKLKIGNGNTLKIFYNGKSVLIRLNGTRTKAIVTMKGKPKFELCTVMEHVEENENSSPPIVIKIPSTTTTNEWAANFLIGYTQSRVPSFLFNLVLNTAAAPDDFRILSQDETFLEALEETKAKFMSNCEMLATMRNAF